MKRWHSILVLGWFSLASSAMAQNDSPPGYADVVIVPDPDNAGRVVITIESVEDPTGGRIRCGRSANDRCTGLSRITWSIQNNSGNPVDVVMTSFYNETTSQADNPFNNDPRRNNIQDGRRRPLPQNIKNAPNEGTYKYHIVVYDRGGAEIGRLDPRLDI